jgi:hypothetical protein
LNESPQLDALSNLSVSGMVMVETSTQSNSRESGYSDTCEIDGWFDLLQSPSGLCIREFVKQRKFVNLFRSARRIAQHECQVDPNSA